MLFRQVARACSLLLATIVVSTTGLLFRPDQFKDMTENCRKSNGKPIRFILNEDNPAMYVSIDPAHPTLMALQRAERVKLFNKFTLDDKGRLLLQVIKKRKEFSSRSFLLWRLNCSFRVISDWLESTHLSPLLRSQIQSSDLRLKLCQTTLHWSIIRFSITFLRYLSFN